MENIYQTISANKQKGIDMVLVTAVDKIGEGPVEVGKKMVVTEHGSVGTVGGGALEHYAIEKSKSLLKTRSHFLERYLLNAGQMTPETKTLPMVCGGRVTLFYEFIGAKNIVYIFGGGHVGQALAHVLKPLNYYIIVIDERKEIIERFQNANELHHTMFVDYIEKEHIKENSIVVVCTPSHQYDYHVINKIIELKLKPKYMGMLCSVVKLKDYLQKTKEMFGDVDLHNFYSPIGLDIGGGSPEEIAISIAAEIMAIDNNKKGHQHMRESAHGKNRYW
jgi:xanthine dehydrogenase accessory factor